MVTMHGGHLGCLEGDLGQSRRGRPTRSARAMALRNCMQRRTLASLTRFRAPNQTPQSSAGHVDMNVRLPHGRRLAGRSSRFVAFTLASARRAPPRLRKACAGSRRRPLVACTTHIKPGRSPPPAASASSAAHLRPSTAASLTSGAGAHCGRTSSSTRSAASRCWSAWAA